METNWAVEHLQVIRTLMERSAVYRRALAPVMVLTGTIGILAGFAGGTAKIDSARAFVVYWLMVSLVAVVGALLMVRRQALKEGEPFWSPPTRRVTQAVLPPLVAGFILTLILGLQIGPGNESPASGAAIARLPATWIILYGCALHAAGFFMPRGMKMFGWAFVLGGCGLFAADLPAWVSPAFLYSHGVMGLFFGVLPLAYWIYLYFTDQRKNVA